MLSGTEIIVTFSINRFTDLFSGFLVPFDSILSGTELDAIGVTSITTLSSSFGLIATGVYSPCSSSNTLLKDRRLLFLFPNFALSLDIDPPLPATDILRHLSWR